MTDQNLRKSLIILSLILLICGLYHYYGPCTKFVNNLLPHRNNDTIVIDPGHGGYDPGKVGVDGTLEKDLNLSIALLLKKYLEDNNYKVIMTRTDDTALCSPDVSHKKTNDLNNRIKIIDSSQPFFTISIHQNSFPDSSVHGAQVFYYGTSSGSTSKEFAEVIQSNLVNTLDPNNHRIAKANTDYYLLRNTTSPIIIVECGFISCPSESAQLKSPDYQDKVAKSIYLGIKEYSTSY